MNIDDFVKCYFVRRAVYGCLYKGDCVSKVQNDKFYYCKVEMNQKVYELRQNRYTK